MHLNDILMSVIHRAAAEAPIGLTPTTAGQSELLLPLHVLDLVWFLAAYSFHIKDFLIGSKTFQHKI